MPKLITIAEGASTVITNMERVAKANKGPADKIMNYFGSKLSFRVEIKENTYSLKGSHENQILLTHLYDYIEKFVLCRTCQNPETDDLSGIKNDIKLKCRACGKGNGEISDNTFVIVNNNPNDFIED